MLLRRVRLGAVLVLCVLAQTAVFSRLRIDDVGPDIGLVATVGLAYREGPVAGALFGFASGLAIDLFLQTPLGLSALAYALTGYLVGVVQSGILRTSWWASPVLGGLGGLVGGVLFAVVGTLAGQSQLWDTHTIVVLLIAAGYDAALAPVVFPLMRRAVAGGGLDRRRGPWRGV